MNQKLKPSVISGLVLAFSSFGDAFLYVVLPVNAPQMKVPLVWIGILLSINRFVRIVANQLFANLFHRFGFKKITIAAALLSMITTFYYSHAGGIVVWLTVRIVWGFCYSALRMSAIGYSLQAENRGFSLGLNKGLQEIGPVIALLVGPILLRWMAPSSTFLIFSLLSVPAIILAFYLPEITPSQDKIQFNINFIPSTFNLLTFLASFFVQGILIVTITKLLAPQSSTMIAIAALAGIYLAYRRICTILIAPLGGIFADKFGIDKTFIISIVLTAVGLLLIANGLTAAGIIVAFTFNSFTSALAPGSIAEGDRHLTSIAANSTWNDIGTAFGALMSGLLLESDNLNIIFAIATFMLMAACTFHIKTTNFQVSGLLKWK